MGRAVLLQHDEGSEARGVHYDLLIERETPQAEHRLLAFRLDEPLDVFGVAEFNAQRVQDHRAVYLDYEGSLPAPGNPASAARGYVRRLQSMQAWVGDEHTSFLEVTFASGAARAMFTAECVSPGAPGDGAAWRFTRR